MLAVYPEFQEDTPCVENPPNFWQAVAQFKAQATKKQQASSLSLRVNFCSNGDLLNQNPSADDHSFSLIKMGSDFDQLMCVSKFM